jgi:hypothetical protein
VNIVRGMTLDQVAFVVCSAFDRAGVVAVLAGGGAAAFYAPASEMTRDLDFVLHFELFGMPKASIIEDLGFTPSNAAGTYKHEDIPFTLEILSGPLEVGDELLHCFETLRRGESVLHVLSATDSVKDRLASGEYFHDLSAIRQAAKIAKSHAVDLASVRSWCESEGATRTHEQFVVFMSIEPPTGKG